MLRLLISFDADLDLLDLAAEQGNAVPWIVPKDAQPGDACAFSHLGEGITHLGELRSNATKNDEPPWKGRYTAEVWRVAALQEPVTHDELAEAFPDWKWPTYPRMYTSVDGALAVHLMDHFGDQTAPLLYDIDEYVATEGRLHLRRHFVRERNLEIVHAKRKHVFGKYGRLCCEVCGFDFAATYGELGKDFCEVHHLQPMSQRFEESETRLEDLAVVCSNCHRMLHRRGLISLASLRDMLRSGAKVIPQNEV